MRTSSQVFAALFVAGSAVLASPHQAQAAVPHHLYLALENNSIGQEILRYRLVNGFPERKPDLVYQGVTTPIAVGSDGTFYATVPFSCCQGVSLINAYPLGSVNPTRVITLPSLSDATIDTALAAGRDGNLYVGYDAFISGAAPRFMDPQSQSPPRHGIAVYGPHANGGSPPLTMYKFVGIETGPVALDVGPQGHLYASGFDINHGHFGHVYDIAKPWSGPNVVSALDVQYDAGGLAFSDETRDFYALEAVTFNPSSSQIQVYHRGAFGQDHPFRTITSSLYLGPALAVVGANLYTITGAVNTANAELIAFPKEANGA